MRVTTIVIIVAVILILFLAWILVGWIIVTRQRKGIIGEREEKRISNSPPLENTYRRNEMGVPKKVEKLIYMCAT